MDVDLRCKSVLRPSFFSSNCKSGISEIHPVVRHSRLIELQIQSLLVSQGDGDAISLTPQQFRNAFERG